MLNQTSLNALKSCLLLLALMGILVKGLIPLGFMPDFSKHAGTAIVICSGIEQKTVYVDQDGQPAQDAGHQVKTPCDFAYTPIITAPVFQSQIVVVLNATAKLIPHEVACTRASLAIPPITGPPTIV
jgi:hypothetical protein